MAFFKGISFFLMGIYAGVILLMTPVLNLLMFLRLRQGKETWKRFLERKGRGSVSSDFHLRSGQKKIIWIHGASIGEMRSALALVAAILEEDPDYCVLLTSQTLSSEEILKPYLSDRVFYQAIPLDHPLYWKRFFNNWNPIALCVFESECWPFLFFYAGYVRKIALLSINFHLSKKSFAQWSKIPWFFRFLYDSFKWISTSCPLSFSHYQKLTGDAPTRTVSLKYASVRDGRVNASIYCPKGGDRTIWMASCFHDVEQEGLCHLILRMHQAIPGLLTILAPRHLDRLDQWEHRLKSLDVRRDECGGDVCLVAELGVLDRYYAKVSVVLLGGSFVSLGGHSLIEPAQFGCNIVCGPNMESCLDVLEDFKKQYAVCQVSGFSQAYDQVMHFLVHPSMGVRAQQVVQVQKKQADECLKKIVQIICEKKR